MRGIVGLLIQVMLIQSDLIYISRAYVIGVCIILPQLYTCFQGLHSTLDHSIGCQGLSRPIRQICWIHHGQGGKKPDLVKVEALKDFPAPRDLTNLKSYLELELWEFASDLMHSLEPLKPLLSTENAYVWNCCLQKAFEKSKEVLCSDQVLKRHNLNRHSVLITDAL